jgi:hypothetical protein
MNDPNFKDEDEEEKEPLVDPAQQYRHHWEQAPKYKADKTTINQQVPAAERKRD